MARREAFSGLPARLKPRLHGIAGIGSGGRWTCVGHPPAVILINQPERVLAQVRAPALRSRLPAGVRMYTGDDFNYAALIGGDSNGHSDALLGIFDAIAPAASAALTALAAGDRATFETILAPTVPLSRHIFAAPTRFYKTGVVFMAWLNGHQAHFTMVGGQQSARSIVHLAELFRLADAAGLLRDPDLAATRMRALLAVHGIDA